MKARAIGATRRRRTQRIAQPAANDGCAAAPARIAGVHVAHIGGQDATVAQIRAYWQSRSAVFMHHSPELGGQLARLEEILDRSHVVFHAPAGANSQLRRDLERYCERAEKPLILLEENSVWALAKALATLLPLT
jgi:hypothetical protein